MADRQERTTNTERLALRRLRRTGGPRNAASRTGSQPQTARNGRAAADGGGGLAAGRRAPGRLAIPRSVPRRVRPETLAALAAGGALGAPARYLAGKAVHVSPGTFPWATLWINLSGSFALGLLLTLIVERWPPTRFVRPFAAVGFLGAYTTFSTFGVEADQLISAGRLTVALSYVLGSLVGGLAAVYLGIALGRWSPGGDRR